MRTGNKLRDVEPRSSDGNDTLLATLPIKLPQHANVRILILKRLNMYHTPFYATNLQCYQNLELSTHRPRVRVHDHLATTATRC
ncbi:hypothetical protein TNCV_3629631 [Trichonephila clavipes]|nr:hypothetical protein TNCV_3629631 [Trichonephila clavipes]